MFAQRFGMNVSRNHTALLTSVPSMPTVVVAVNKTAFGHLIDDLVAVLDEGPAAFDPKVAVTLAIATPLVLLAMCLLCLVCRGVPYTMCGGRCTHWKRMPKEPKGLEPDAAIGEHQDEHCDVDSADEEARVDQTLPYDDYTDEVALENACGNGQRECCSKMAAVLEAGGMEMDGSSESHPVVKCNGKTKAVSIVEPSE